MSWARIYRERADHYRCVTDGLVARTGFDNMANIAREKHERLEKFAQTAARWVAQGETPLDKRPGGFPGDPFNSTATVLASPENCTRVQKLA